MRIVVGVVAMCALGAGCTGDGSFTIKVRVGDAALVDAQDGDGPWQQLVPNANGIARFEVTTGRYGLLRMCDYGTQRYVGVRYDAARPDAVVDLSCTGDPVTFVDVAGHTAPGATVWVDDYPTTADASGAYSVGGVMAGSRDVFAVLPGSPARLLTMRGVDLTADRALDLPVATDGVAMTTMTPTVIGASGPVTVYSDMNTLSGDYVDFGEGPMVANVPPPGALIAGDRPSIGARSMNCTAQAVLGPDAPTLVMPAPFSVEIDHDSARWHADDSIDWASFTAQWRTQSYGPPFTETTLRIDATPEWLEASGAGSVLPAMELSGLLPGWQPGMAEFKAGQQIAWDVWITRGDPSGDYDGCGGYGSFTW